MNTTETNVAPSLEKLRDHLEGLDVDRNPGVVAALAIVNAAPTLPRGTMRSWFTAHNGQAVSTIQLSPFSLWAPRGRIIDASHATFILLDGSRRYYEGCRVVGANDDMLTVVNDTEVIIYAVTDPPTD
jgi:hypothetical protein